MLQISLISIQFWGTVSRFRNWSVTEPCWTCPVCLPKYQLFKLLHPFFEVRGRARIEGQINYRELMLFTKSSTFGQHPNRVIYSFLTLIDSFFFLYKHKKMKELQPLSSVATQPTHPSSFKTPFYLPFQPEMDSVGWHDVLAYLPSTPMAAIFQVAAWLWYYDYYISNFILPFGSASLVSP